MKNAAAKFERPRLQLKRRPVELAIDVVALLVIAFNIVMVIRAWPTLPDRIAHHFDFAGNPDSWGGKWILIFLPAVSIILYAILTGVSRIPHRFNYLWEITPQNAERQYRIALSMLLMLKAEVATMFCYLTWVMIRSASENFATLGRLFLPVVVGAIFLTIVIHLVAASRAR